MAKLLKAKMSLQTCQKQNCEAAYAEATKSFDKLLRKIITRPDSVSEEKFMKDTERMLNKFVKSVATQSLYKCTMQKCPKRVDAVVRASKRDYKDMCKSGSEKACAAVKDLERMPVRSSADYTAFVQKVQKHGSNPKCNSCSFPV